MGRKTSRFTSCAKRRIFSAITVLFLFQLQYLTLSAQSSAPTSTPIPGNSNADASMITPTNSPTSTPTFNPFATPTWTFTWDPFATDTPTPGSPTPTFTPTETSTPTVTGTQSPSMTFTPTITNTPSISRASLALLSTAYSNGWDHWDKWNWDIGFSYYIGSIAEKDMGSSTQFLNPLRLWLLTSDLKYGWMDQTKTSPGIASGLLMTLLLNGGNPGATGGASQNFQLTGNSMGGIYTVLSQSIAKNTAVHFGYVFGFRDAFKSIGLGSFAPNLNYSDFLPLLTNNPQDLEGGSPPSLFYTGWDWRLLGTNWKFEIWKPFPMPQNPVLLNTQIDGLFAFNLAYERWQSGYALLGYFNFRFTIIPNTPAY